MMHTKPQSKLFFGLNIKKFVLLLIMILLFGFIFWKSKQIPKVEKPEKSTEQEEEDSSKDVQGLTFGSWKGGGRREVLATVESFGDVTINAELSGTINQVFVDIGDKVYRGQVLARFERGNDQTFINYQNAVSSLEQLRATTQNSVTQAEIALNNARAEFESQKKLQESVNSQSFTGLETQSLTATTSVFNALDWADRIVQASEDYRNEANGDSSYVGKNNTQLKQRVKIEVARLKRSLNTLNTNFGTKQQALLQARARLDLLSGTRLVLQQMDDLIRQTPTTASFRENQRVPFEQQVDGFQSTIDGQITAVRSQIESVGSQGNQSNLALEQAQNRITTAQANLELAKANALASIKASENSLGLASSTLADLDVQSPFNGTVTEKFIADFQQVTPGTALFSIVDNQTAPKVSAFVTKSELTKLMTATDVSVTIDDKTLAVSSAAMSTKVDSATQKIKVEYTLPVGEESLVGSLGKLQIPSAGASDKIVPLTAVSFEPDGAEVMVVENGVVARKKVVVGEIVSGGIEILDGINEGDKIVQYRSRVYVGEKVNLQ